MRQRCDRGLRRTGTAGCERAEGPVPRADPECELPVAAAAGADLEHGHRGPEPGAEADLDHLGDGQVPGRARGRVGRIRQRRRRRRRRVRVPLNRFVVNTIPTRTPRQYDRGRLDPLERSSSFVDTFQLGSLDAGRTVTFRWNVTAVHPGPFKICYRVNAGLFGKAVAVPSSSGEPIAGTFTGGVAQKPPQAHIAADGHTVVEGTAQSGNSP